MQFILETELFENDKEFFTWLREHNIDLFDGERDIRCISLRYSGSFLEQFSQFERDHKLMEVITKLVKDHKKEDDRFINSIDLRDY